MRNHSPKINKYFKLLALCLILLGYVLGMPSEAHGPQSVSASEDQATYKRVFYFREGENARNSLFAHPNSIDILAPQTYYFDSKGVLQGELKEDIRQFASEHRIDVMPLVTNGAFAQQELKAVLENHKIQKKAIARLVSEAIKYDYVGWQIDFEQMNVNYKDEFNSFVRDLSVELHKRGKLLSVAVVTKISDRPEDYKNTLWQDLIGVYDYDALGTYCDFVSIMSYDAPDSKGAIAPYDWLITATNYATEHIPKEKISLGIGLYYWKWDDARAKITGIGGFEGLKTALTKYNVKLGYSSKDKAPFMKYVKDKKAYTIWYENQVSVKEKIDIISRLGLHGFSAWALGLEVPAIHDVVKRP